MVGSILPLNVENAVVRRRGKVLVGPINAEVSKEGLTIVMGPNGAGKTTLLRLLHGMERVAPGGQIKWQIPEPKARGHQAFLFQAPIMMRRSALENVAYPLIVHGVGRKEALAQAEQWLSKVGLQESGTKRATVLSGGERQKLALARALIRQPQILFLDEPCANLDGRATREFETLLHNIHEDGTRIVMSTHDIGQARRLAQDVWFIHHGQILETTPAGVFFDNPMSKEARAFLQGDIIE